MSDIAIQTRNFSITLSDDGRWRSILMQEGRELCETEADLPFAVIYEGKTGRNCSTTTLEGEELKLRFDGVDTELIYGITRVDDWIVFELQRISGTRPHRVLLCQVPVCITEHVGRRLNIAWDDDSAVCLMAANVRVDCEGVRREYAHLQAATQDSPGPSLEGSAVMLIACPTSDVRRVLRAASHAGELLTNEQSDGTPVKDTDPARSSYWFLRIDENDADRAVEYCRQTGFDQVMVTGFSWFRSIGHYPFDEERFPTGKDGLRTFVDKLHAHGIKVGMHVFVSKVSKIDAYVTPVPDKRFWVDQRTVLSGDITANQNEIRAGDLRQWPGSSVCTRKLWEGGVRKHREVIIGDEIIRYEAIGPEGKWDTFLGCARGAWGTRPSAHKGDEEGCRYGVDGSFNAYIIDQETDLLDEVTDRAAAVFNYCGFDMVYFDGGEDVPGSDFWGGSQDRPSTRYNYYVSRCQQVAMRKFKKRPIIHMGTIMTHRLWHSFARSGTVDVYLDTIQMAIDAGKAMGQWPSVKEHVDRSVEHMLATREDLMPGELGWFGIWPKGDNTDGLQLDGIEYLMCKSLGYDAPVSLSVRPGDMESHPLTPEILNIVHVYDQLRMTGEVDEHTRAKLCEQGKDFALIQCDGTRQFAEVNEVPRVAGSRDIRSFAGTIPGGTVATIWHYAGKGEIAIPIAPAKVRVIDFLGSPVATRDLGNRFSMSAGSRRHTMLFTDLSLCEVEECLAAASHLAER